MLESSEKVTRAVRLHLWLHGFGGGRDRIWIGTDLADFFSSDVDVPNFPCRCRAKTWTKSWNPPFFFSLNSLTFSYCGNKGLSSTSYSSISTNQIGTLVGARRRSSRVLAPTFDGFQGAGTGPLLAHFFVRFDFPIVVVTWQSLQGKGILYNDYHINIGNYDKFGESSDRDARNASSSCDVWQPMIVINDLPADPLPVVKCSSSLRTNQG